ncbi:hypothetical protein HMPREF0208_00471 [Citrobacter koseri]|uniref:Uncharacterized protein n=1 Tax=Citrobacter koseri (strain ATCC BAA-895 / CDC 4225-83 / SGSC4696) TaxID=290338 RepID=A8AK83_CITK8|nr:hypothetical protein CKO_02789 [Citrobacter koseri ATCC BAA-895]KXA01932.1 hypothetical protein HMPREF3220_01284 [Citrobacter koseri]KXA05432.1 hypothetical protein HMPREF3207_00781 [Citrobacter koseri]KXB46854.1 hypothetical protein HMPREF0208_00471 [Citrobacter koseri]
MTVFPYPRNADVIIMVHDCLEGKSSIFMIKERLSVNNALTKWSETFLARK